jgi:hypothetical protein
MLPLANVVNFFPYKFSSLGGGSLAFTGILPGAPDCFLLWHIRAPWMVRGMDERSMVEVA